METGAAYPWDRGRDARGPRGGLRPPATDTM